jgi:hypothetical protein
MENKIPYYFSDVFFIALKYDYWYIEHLKNYLSKGKFIIRHWLQQASYADIWAMSVSGSGNIPP